MADEQQNQPGETPAPAAAATTQTVPEKGPDGQPFDAARAMTTIEKLRDEIKGLKGTAKERDDLATRLREIEDKDKSEAERNASKAADAEKKLSETEGRLRSMAIRVAVAESAAAAGIAPENVKAALRLLDADAIALDGDGEPKNVEATLKALVKEYPILAGTANGKADRGTATDLKANNSSTSREDTDQVRQKLIASGGYPRF
jgi:hypothetical protein